MVRPVDTSLAKYLSCGKRRSRALQASWQIFFAERWAEFLRENFHTPEQIAVAFGVTAQTARNWLDGTAAPRGHAVALAFTDPELAPAITKHLERA